MINKLSVAALIGRELTDPEATVLEWLNGWESATSSTVAKLIQAAYQNGAIVALSRPRSSELRCKETGIVRRIDDLGRVVIPKSIRRPLGIGEGDPLEFYTYENSIILKKYAPGCFICRELDDEKLHDFQNKQICEACIKSIVDTLEIRQ
ncbi:AbrB/MazE/SpoVT family DNA-binding domain-containing protein [Paenibacillus lautus]|jgi:transcriptional pleiotropic regulator of transition state genes|uniref:AbrB/MazE/SpoVT family DNA-binding domain-containing protein n=1 Tax=Paenibacillus lautus TaxID=1401 RepID=UPI00350E429B